MPRTPAPLPQHVSLEHAPHENASHGSPQHPAPDRWETSRLASFEQAIRERAYELYLARKGGPGNATDDWLLAEAAQAGINGAAGRPGVQGRPSVDR